MNFLNTILAVGIAAVPLVLGGCAAPAKNPSAQAVMQSIEILPKQCPSEIVSQARVNCSRHGGDTSAQTRSNNIKNTLMATGLGAVGGAGGGALIGAVTPDRIASRCYRSWHGYVVCDGGGSVYGNNAGRGAAIGSIAGSVIGLGYGLYNMSSTQEAFDAAYLECFAYYKTVCEQAIQERQLAYEKELQAKQERGKKKKGSKKRSSR